MSGKLFIVLVVCLIAVLISLKVQRYRRMFALSAANDARGLARQLRKGFAFSAAASVPVTIVVVWLQFPGLGMLFLALGAVNLILAISPDGMARWYCSMFQSSCPKCGHTLRGEAESRCPICGETP